MKRTLMVMAVVMSCALPAQAQLNGENLLGDMGVKSGTQPEPGLCLEHLLPLLHRYDQGPEGQSHRARSDAAGKSDHPCGDAAVLYVTPKKGARRELRDDGGAAVRQRRARSAGPWLGRGGEHGPSDLYVMPAQLGWHFKRADVIAGVGFFARPAVQPRRERQPRQGHVELRGVGGRHGLSRSTARSFSLSTTAFWETHGKKDGEVHVETSRSATSRSASC